MTVHIVLATNYDVQQFEAEGVFDSFDKAKNYVLMQLDAMGIDLEETDEVTRTGYYSCESWSYSVVTHEVK